MHWIWICCGIVYGSLSNM
uniref:Uncharacterized protein n=1 Tax=Rhizophora mucronata TaxID=61149 RepID=A0A2P2PDI3_RHIMU